MWCMLFSFVHNGPNTNIIAGVWNTNLALKAKPVFRVCTFFTKRKVSVLCGIVYCHKTLQINNYQCEFGHISGLYGLQSQPLCCLLLVPVVFVFLSLSLLMPVMLIIFKNQSQGTLLGTHSMFCVFFASSYSFQMCFVSEVNSCMYNFQKYNLLFIFLLSLLLRSFLNSNSNTLDSWFPLT